MVGTNQGKTSSNPHPSSSSSVLSDAIEPEALGLLLDSVEAYMKDLIEKAILKARTRMQDSIHQVATQAFAQAPPAMSLSGPSSSLPGGMLAGEQLLVNTVSYTISNN